MDLRTFLMVQWLRIHLPMQRTWVWSLVRENPTCCGATKSMHHKYWVQALEPPSRDYWSPHTYSLYSATKEATAMRSLPTAMKSRPCSPQPEKTHMQQQRPAWPQIKFFLKKWTYIDIFPKKIHKSLTSTWKDVQHCWLLVKCKSKPQWGTTSHRSEWLSSKSL